MARVTKASGTEIGEGQETPAEDGGGVVPAGRAGSPPEGVGRGRGAAVPAPPTTRHQAHPRRTGGKTADDQTRCPPPPVRRRSVGARVRAGTPGAPNRMRPGRARAPVISTNGSRPRNTHPPSEHVGHAGADQRARPTPGTTPGGGEHGHHPGPEQFGIAPSDDHVGDRRYLHRHRVPGAPVPQPGPPWSGAVPAPPSPTPEEDHTGDIGTGRARAVRLPPGGHDPDHGAQQETR